MAKELLAERKEERKCKDGCLAAPEFPWFSGQGNTSCAHLADRVGCSSPHFSST